MKMSKYIVILIAIAFSACSMANIDMSGFRKGINKTDTITKLSEAKAFSYDGNVEDNVYDITDQVGSGGPIEIIITKRQEASEKYYIFAFENDRLLYWGNPVEFNRHDNPKLNKIGLVIINLIKTNYDA